MKHRRFGAVVLAAVVSGCPAPRSSTADAEVNLVCDLAAWEREKQGRRYVAARLHRATLSREPYQRIADLVETSRRVHPRVPTLDEDTIRAFIAAQELSESPQLGPELACGGVVFVPPADITRLDGDLSGEWLTSFSRAGFGRRGKQALVQVWHTGSDHGRAMGGSWLLFAVKSKERWAVVQKWHWQVI